ncbi:unnamed protein product [Gongylonema pulchrum]|uniref:Uncharacterized protein n=1 Tax=Gongylonema pulchrum TaxID=637853 RepID=A0A3P7RKI1_9BILA|nr:unnamed protein product [Gongylonema pulchrum]
MSTEQPPIATFDEWTKEKLKREEIRRTNSIPKAAHDVTSLPSPDIIPQQATPRNYASRDCGAKVLFSNEEAENKVNNLS